MKKNSTIAAIIGLLLTVSTMPAFAITLKENRISLPVYATNESGIKTLEPKNENKLTLTKNNASESGEKTLGPKKEALINTKTDNFKQRASSEITRRITSLTNIINKISAIKRLTQSQKDSLTNGIQAEIASLTALNTKIQADADIATLRTDVKSIVTSYRVYLLYLPQIQIIIAADKLLTTADTLTELAAKLQARINEAKGKGEDITTLETTLADMQAKIADSKTQANAAIDTASALQPTDYPGNKPSLQNARALLQIAHKDLITARQDAQKIVVALKKSDKNITGAPTSTITESEIKTKPSYFPPSISNTQPTE